MLAAYYSIGANAEKLFEGLEIERNPTFKQHLNKHPVIYFDLPGLKDGWNELDGRKPTLVKYIKRVLLDELSEEYPEIKIAPRQPLRNAMIAVSSHLK